MKEDNQLPIYQSEPGDEIDLKDIILPIWKAKYRIILVSFLCILLPCPVNIALR